MSAEIKNVKHIHVECAPTLKKRLELYCVNTDERQKDVVIMALEAFLDLKEKALKYNSSF